MPTVSHVPSHETLVLIDENPITGCVGCKLNSNLDLFTNLSLGEQTSSDYLKLGSQTHNLELEWVFSPYSADMYIGGRSTTNDFLSSGKYDFIVRDTVEQKLISGAYLTSFSLRASVGEVPTFVTQFDCNTVDFNTSSLTTRGEDSITGEISVFTPQGVKLHNIGVEPFVGTGNNCIQSVSISADIPRIPVTKLGNRIPSFRAIKGDSNIEVSVSALKQEAKTMPSNYLNGLSQDVGEMTIVFDTQPVSTALTASISNLTLSNIQEDLDIQGNAILTYNYKGLLDSGSFSIQ